MNDFIQTTRLAGGLTILTEKMPDLRSATIGIWLNKGSRDESAHVNGIFHFIEHAVFKGTKKRTALDIAIETDRLGGHFDAFTSHEQTGFTMKVVDSAVAGAFDLLADLLANPLFEERELKREQKVIIEEMKMVEDTPEEFLGELFNREFFAGHPLGLPIEGTRRTVKTFNHQITADFHRAMFQPQNLIIAAAGNVDHEQIVELAEQYFGQNSPSLGKPKAETRNPKLSAPILLEKKRALEQAHLIIATPFIDAKSDQRYAASLLGNILGGGTSSRLWQSVREKRGLAYSVGASAMTFQDCGMLMIYAGTSPAQLGEVIDLSIAEMRRFVRETVSKAELELVKQQAVASVLLSLESSNVRAATLAESEMTHGRQIAVDETLAKVAAVTPDDVRAIASEFFHTEKIALAALGNLNNLKIERSRLQI